MSKLQGVSVGHNPTGGGGGGKSGRSMEAALHANTGWIEAPEMSAGDGGTPMHETDAEELGELSRTFLETMKRLGRKLFGIQEQRPAASEVRAVAEPKPVETLEPPKAEPVKEPVEQPKQPIPDNVVKLDQNAIIGKRLKAYAAIINNATIGAGDRQAKELEAMGDEAKQCVDALKRMHGANELMVYAKELKHLPPSEAASRIRQKGAQLRDEAIERLHEQAMAAKMEGPKPAGPAPRTGR